jgi:hypothetical protein
LESKPGERVYLEGAEFESTSARTLRVWMVVEIQCRRDPIAPVESKEEDIRGHTTRSVSCSRNATVAHSSVNIGFTTLDTKEAAWVNPETKSVHRIRTKHGFCLAPTFIGASLS